MNIIIVQICVLELFELVSVSDGDDSTHPEQSDHLKDRQEPFATTTVTSIPLTFVNARRISLSGLPGHKPALFTIEFANQINYYLIIVYK